MVRRSHPFLKLFLVFALLVFLAIVCRSWWLPVVAKVLVRDEGPAKAAMAVVLAGDYRGTRLEKAAQLVRAGYVPAVLVDGPDGFFGAHECDLAIDYMVHKGYPRDWFVAFPIAALSTQDEATLVLDELDRRQIHSILLVTSDFHTARAARIFRAMLRKRASNLELRVVSAPSAFFHPDSWWHTREGCKETFVEWSKTLAEAVGL